MARIALIKIFTGLNLAPAQLSGELQRAGHDSRIIYFKDHYVANFGEHEGFEVTDYPGIFTAIDGSKRVWNCYKPFTNYEFGLLIEELNEFKPDAIGFSIISGIIKEAALVTEKLREHFSVPIIWGGPGPTLEPERCIAIADLVCINEGEEVIVELAEKLDAKADITDIAGTWSRKPDGEIVQNPQRPLLKLDDIAIPDWNTQHYVHINSIRGRRSNIWPSNIKQEYPIMTQRGCPFSCSFCIESRYQELFGKKNSLRRRSVDIVLQELRWAKDNLDIKTVLFYDDVFTVNPRWLKEFLPRYKAEIGLDFWCYTYPTTHDVELLHLLKDAGMTFITMGIQSGSARILKEHFNRPTETARVLEAAREIVDLGPEVVGYFDLISKVPFEKEEDLRATFEFLLELPKELRTLGLVEMCDFPTYDYTRQSEELGRVLASDKNATSSGDETNRQLATSAGGLSEADYDYYHKLYLLTRTSMPVAEIRAIAENPLYRENPALLDDFNTNESRANFTGISF
jgi:anaerobic magnesium-protoporphyrin IX monomethyl ester cyclase